MGDIRPQELAFWLQDKLSRDGIEGLHFMRDARLWAEENAADVTAQTISKAENCERTGYYFRGNLRLGSGLTR